MKAGNPRFGTDGIRGVANDELTAHLALKLGVAAAYVLGKHSSERHVVVGRDTRRSGDMLEAALVAGKSALDELNYRRKGLFIALAVIAMVLIGLVMKIRVL